MAFASSAKGAVAGFASASLVLAVSVLASSPGRAADDASPGFFSGVLSSVGLAPDHAGRAGVDYQVRPKLVTPPKNDLPPPAPDHAARDSSWPQENDVDARRREASDANRHLSDAPRAPGAGPQRQLLTQPPAAYLAPIANAPAAPAAEEKPWYKFW